MIKISAVAPEHHIVEAPAKVFTSQAEFLQAFDEQRLNEDFVAVVLNQGPTSNGMPELHKLTPGTGGFTRRGLSGRAGDRWSHVRSIGQSAGSHSHHARMCTQWPAE